MTTLYLIAHIAGRGVAIDTAQVDSVVEIGAIVPVSRAHKAVLGLAALRSRVVTVVDTWQMLGLEQPGKPPRAIVTRIDGHDYAILFDTIEDVASLNPMPVPPGLVLDGSWGRAARGAVVLDGEPILVIGLDDLVPVAPLAAAA